MYFFASLSDTCVSHCLFFPLHRQPLIFSDNQHLTLEVNYSLPTHGSNLAYWPWTLVCNMDSIPGLSYKMIRNVNRLP